MKRPRDLRLLAGLIVAFTVLWFAVGGEAPEPSNDPRASSFNAAHRGVRAWYLLLEELKCPTDAVTSMAPARLGRFKTLAVIEPGEMDSGGDVNALDRWVQQGGQLIFVESYPRASPLGDHLGVRVRPAAVFDSQVPVEPRALPLRPARRLFAGVRRFSRLPPNAEAWAVDSHGTLIASWKHGRGRIIALADPKPVMNAWIDRNDNARMAVMLSSTGPIGFDEYHHGYRDGGPPETFWERLGAPTRMAVWQLLLAALLLVAYVSRRFGPVVDPERSGTRTPGEYVVSLGTLLARAKADRAVLELIAGEFRSGLARRCGMPQDAPDEALAAAAAERWRIPRDRIESALNPSNDPPLTASRRIAELRQEMETHA